MKLTVLVGASALVLALSTAGFAATSAKPMKVVLKPAERCASLQTQFDTAWPMHKTGKLASSAEKLRADGGKLCTAKHYAAGERKIVAALKDIGVKASI
ncbi:MAG: hypothetical protein ABI399_07190 [Bauldia sp.]